jgi:hypothetical protein
MEGVKLGEAAKISFIGRDDGNPAAARAHGQQGIIGQTSLSNLFVVISGSQAGQQLSSQSPIVEVRHEHPSGLVEVALQPLDDSRVTWLHSRIKFFKNNGAEPKWRARSVSPKLEDRIVTCAQCGDINGGVEKYRSHLLGQLAVHILYSDATLHKALVGFDGQLVAFVFGDHGIKGTFDRLGLRLGPQNLLGTTNLYRIELEVLV